MNAEEKRRHPRQRKQLCKGACMLSSFTSEPGMRWPKSVSREKRTVQVMEDLRAQENHSRCWAEGGVTRGAFWVSALPAVEDPLEGRDGEQSQGAPPLHPRPQEAFLRPWCRGCGFMRMWVKRGDRVLARRSSHIRPAALGGWVLTATSRGSREPPPTHTHTHVCRHLLAPLACPEDLGCLSTNPSSSLCLQPDWHGRFSSVSLVLCLQWRPREVWLHEPSPKGVKTEE